MQQSELTNIKANLLERSNFEIIQLSLFLFELCSQAFNKL